MALLLVAAVVMPAGLVVLPGAPVIANVNTVVVIPSPTTAGVTADYPITFNITVPLTTAAVDTITVVFPTGTVIPSNVSVTVNGAVPSLVTIAGTSVTLRLSADITISAVSVLFNGVNKITNPTAAGPKTLTVQTSQESAPVTSGTYTIVAGALSSLVLDTGPTTTITGQIMAAMLVGAHDLYGNHIDGVNIYVMLWSGTGTLSGTLTKTTTGGGTATFNDLRIDTEGTKILYFYSGPFHVSSSSFTISAAASITSPINGSPAYAKTGGTVPVVFTINCATPGTGDLRIQVLQAGTTTAVAFADVNNISLSGGANPFNYDVTMTGVTANTYDVRVGVRQPTGSGTWVYSTVQSNAVVVDNTAPAVTLLTPDGGNYVPWGNTSNVSWNVTDAIPAPDSITIRALASIDGGLTYPYTAFGPESGQPKSGSYPWVPGSIGIPWGDHSLARMQLIVTDLAGNSWSDNSTSNFYILTTDPQIIMSIPNSATSWAGGSSQNITFTTTSALNLNVDYKLQINTCGSWSNITPGTDGWLTNRPAGLTTYNWTVPADYRGTAHIQAGVRDKSGNEAWCPAIPFTITDIQAPKVTVTGPTTGGDPVYSGRSTNICWKAWDNVTSICTSAQPLTYKWYLSTDGGSNWGSELGTWYAQPQAPTTPICQSWMPSVTETKTNCKIKVTATDFAATPNTGEGLSNTFTIIYGTGVNPTVTLTAPNSGTLQGGTCQTISWTATDPANADGLLDYVLAYSLDGGSDNYPYPIATLENQEQGSNSFCWAVPVSAGTQYRVKVTATSPNGSDSAASSSDIIVAAADAAVIPATVTLQTGWNLVSLQLMPICVPSTTTTITGQPITSVLADALTTGRIESVWYWPGGSTGQWQSWAPGGDTPVSLTSMTDGKAYWIKATGGTTFTYLGRKGPPGGGFPTTPYSYVVGWNMVGFKSTSTTKHVETYLGGTCGTTYGAPIYGWNAATQAWTSPGCTDDMIPGSGYFVNFNTAHTVNAPAD